MCIKRHISWWTCVPPFSKLRSVGRITSFFCCRDLDLYSGIGNFLDLGLLLNLLILRSRADRMGKLPKPYLLCISFTQRFRGRITSILFCWKALDLYFECPPQFWSLSATINLNLESKFSIFKKFKIFVFFKIFDFFENFQNFQKKYNFCFNSCHFFLIFDVLKRGQSWNNM